MYFYLYIYAHFYLLSKHRQKPPVLNGQYLLALRWGAIIKKLSPHVQGLRRRMLLGTAPDTLILRRGISKANYFIPCIPGTEIPFGLR